MPYSNRRRHNSPSIPQTPYQTLITPYPNFDPIYQVILLKNSNEWNLSLAKEGSSKKRERERNKDWKGKEVKPQLKSAMFWENKRGWNLHAAGRDSIEKRKKGDHNFL
jgi:hypothetical protein